MPTNLFRSPKFELPADWKLIPAAASTPRETGQISDWAVPRLDFVNDTARIELNWGPFWAGFTQDVSGLIVGATYKISITINAEMRHPENGQPAGDPLSVQARIRADGSSSEWKTGAILAHGVPVTISALYTATGTAHALGVEVKAIHSLWQNRFILSNPTLELVNLPANTPPADDGPPISGKYDILTNLVDGLHDDTAVFNALAARLNAGLDAVKAEVIRLRENAS